MIKHKQRPRVKTERPAVRSCWACARRRTCQLWESLLEVSIRTYHRYPFDRQAAATCDTWRAEDVQT